MSALAVRPPKAAAPSLSDMQRRMMAWSSSRRTAFGLVIPNYAIPITALGSVVAPAYGAGNQVVLAEYQVRANWYAVFYGVVVSFFGSGSAPLPGDLQWTVDVDTPLGTTEGHPEKDYGGVQVLLGSLTGGPPWPVEFKHNNNETVRLKAFTIANMGVGVGNFLTGALLGFEWPEEGHEGF